MYFSKGALTDNEKAELSRKVTDLIVKEAKQPQHYTWVMIHEVPAENWMVDRLTLPELKAKLAEKRWQELLFVAIVNCVSEKMKELAEFAKTRGPVKGIRVTGNYGTPVGKGVTILEAENEEAVFAYFSPMLQFFNSIEVYPALPMEKVMQFARTIKRWTKIPNPYSFFQSHWDVQIEKGDTSVKSVLP
jgi:phenylpyruvate tautomerase PptA (4-oxalocrotonate tautomerase family)